MFTSLYYIINLYTYSLFNEHWAPGRFSYCQHRLSIWAIVKNEGYQDKVSGILIEIHTPPSKRWGATTLISVFFSPKSILMLPTSLRMFIAMF